MVVNKKFQVDVLVCGGGVAGCAAGIAAARMGMRTLLIESRESLGGLATNGYITGIAGWVEGMVREWVERLNKRNAVIMRDHCPIIDPEIGKLELEQMLLQAGCRILYGVHAGECLMDGRRITGVMAYSKSGKLEIGADIVIDATGDADIAFAAGVPCDVGNAEFMGLNESVSMGFRLSHVNINRFLEAEDAWQAAQHDVGSRTQLIVAKEREAIVNGDLPYMIIPGSLVFPVPGTDMECGDITFDATQTTHCHNDDVEDLTRQIVDQHRQIELMYGFFRKYIPGFESCQLSGIANMNGVRDSRRAIGEYIVTDADLAGGSKFADSVFHHTEFLDAHHPTCMDFVAVRHTHLPEPVGSAVCRPSEDDDNLKMHPYVRPGGYEVRTNPRDWSGLPYRALVSRGVDNLFTVGRCFSSQFHALGSYRIIAACMGMGHAAGVAAAMCLHEKLLPRELDGKRVQAVLIAQGVPLDKDPDGYWRRLREMKGEFRVASSDFVVIVDESGQQSATF